MSLRNIAYVRSVAVSAVLICVAASSGCKEVLDPCWKDFGKDAEADAIILSTLLSDKQWPLKTINGSPIPSTGFIAPDASARLYGGSLTFQTNDWWGDKTCGAAFESVGVVIGTYDVHLPGAPSIPGQNAGSFHAMHEAGTVVFAAAKATKTATLAGTIGSRTITAQGIRIRNLGDQLYTLVFQER